MSINTRKKTERGRGRGRPPVDSEELRVRVGRLTLTALDEWASAHNQTRQEAVRQILAAQLFESRSQRRIALSGENDNSEGSD